MTQIVADSTPSLLAESKQQKAISNCNSALAICLDKIEGKQMTVTERLLRERGCLNNWNDCMDKAGAPKEGRRNPLKHREIDSGKAPNSGGRTEATPTPPKVGAGDRGMGGKPLSAGPTASPTASVKGADTGASATKPLGRKKKSGGGENQ